MKKIILGICMMSSVFSAFATDTPEQAFPFFAHVEKVVNNNTVSYEVKATWGADEGYHLYYDKFFFASVGAVLEQAKIPHGTMVQVDGTMIEENKGIVEITIPIEVIKSNHFTLIAKSQGCADQSICYPPQTRTLELSIPQ